jgi:nucleoside-diphosphate-sugar epimerase
MNTVVLVLGACGQIGTELSLKLRSIYGSSNVIASDIKHGSDELMESGPFELIDATNGEQILEIIQKYKVNTVYLLAAMLSATAEKHPQKAWNLNMKSLSIVLDLAKDGHIKQIYWPSSIAVFGPTSPKINTPQNTILQPTTVYGISKLSGEYWCNYYHSNFGVDVRSLRYPGIVSWKTEPGGGTTDYAVDIYIKAVKEGRYTSFLSGDTRLPMMYMDDAINATIQLMEADSNALQIRTSYNLSGFDCTPEEVANSIKKVLPDFTIDYDPDFRQKIADSWPDSIDDQFARQQWNWKHSIDLDEMSKIMISNISKTVVSL